MAPRSLEYHDVMGTRSSAVLLVSDVNVKKVLFSSYCYFIFTWCHVFFISWICLLVIFVFAGLGLFGLSYILVDVDITFSLVSVSWFTLCVLLFVLVLLCGVMVRFFVRLFCVAALFINKNAHMSQSRPVDRIPQSCIGCNRHL